MTNNGKVDRRALPEPDSDSFVTQDYVAPQGEIEVALAGIWSELLKIDQVGRHDNFFMLGGHSLLAVRLMNRVSTLGAQLPLSTLFSAPTLSALAEVDEQQDLPGRFITVESLHLSREMVHWSCHLHSSACGSLPRWKALATSTMSRRLIVSVALSIVQHWRRH